MSGATDYVSVPITWAECRSLQALIAHQILGYERADNCVNDNVGVIESRKLESYFSVVDQVFRGKDIQRTAEESLRRRAEPKAT